MAVLHFMVACQKVCLVFLGLCEVFVCKFYIAIDKGLVGQYVVWFGAIISAKFAQHYIF